MRRYYWMVAVIFAALVVIFIAGCGDEPSSVNNDQRSTDTQLQRYQKSQPVPAFDWSQVRQNLIEIQSAQVNTTQTTTFFFVRGGQFAKPISECPSIGYPIPSTYQLTNPLQAVRLHDSTTTIGQAEATGVYTGESSATYVMCVNAQGKAHAVYWEGDVLTFTGPATWNEATGRADLVGPPSFNFSEKK